MATTLIDWRPSALAAACAPIPAQGHLLGQPAATTYVRTAPTFVEPVRAAVRPRVAEVRGAVTLNNSIGAPAAAEGTATSSFIAMAAAMLAGQLIAAQGKALQRNDVDTVKGEDARGIPPRGRRQV